MESEFSLRVVTPEDAAALLAVYAPYVTDTAISFEWQVPQLEEFRGRIRRTLQRYPYLAAVRGEELLGYAYTHPFVGRAAYDWGAETTIYLRRDCRHRGLGKALYTALEGISRAQHIHTLYACIGTPSRQEDEHLTWNSAQFHAHLGFRLVGTFQNCGRKFDRWYDMIWMEKQLSPLPEPPAPVIPFPELAPEVLAGLGIQA